VAASQNQRRSCPVSKIRDLIAAEGKGRHRNRRACRSAKGIAAASGSLLRSKPMSEKCRSRPGLATPSIWCVSRNSSPRLAILAAASAFASTAR
jgi:hypothetical protein